VPGIPAMYACTGASPSAFAMRGLPPERTTATFSPFRTLIGLASLAPGLAFAPTFAGPLLLVIGFRYDKLARSFLDALHITATTQIDLERQRRDYRVCRERSRGSDAASCPRLAPINAASHHQESHLLSHYRGWGMGRWGAPLRDHLWQGPPVTRNAEIDQGVMIPPTLPFITFNSILERGRKVLA
jgi:hypothetical protein